MTALQSTRTSESSSEPSGAESRVDLSTACATDSDLLDAWARDKEVAALSLLVRRHSAMVLSVCRRRCHHACDADDAYQTTFLYLAKNAAKINHPERLPGWLHRVAQRAAVATNRNLTIAGGDMLDRIPDSSREPLDELGRRHNAILLDEELAELPEHYRSAIVMHLYGEQTIEQMADTLRSTTGAVRGWLQRGKKMLASRLRRRGVVPVVAFAAAQSFSVTTAQAESASQFISDPTGHATLPQSPLDLGSLEAAVDLGAGWTSAVVASGVALGCLCIAAMTVVATGRSSKPVVTITSNPNPAVATVPVQINPESSPQRSSPSTSLPKNPKRRATPPTKSEYLSQFGGLGGQGSPPAKVPSWDWQTKVPIAEGETAERVREQLDEPFDFQVNGPLRELPAVLTKLTGSPVLFDDRGVRFAEIDLEQVAVVFEETQVPLRTALKQILAPHGLRAVIEEEGIVVTADPEVLVHRGIGDSKWISMDEETAAMFHESLRQATKIKLIETPLDEAVSLLSEEMGIPVLIHEIALEAIGLTTDVSVGLSVEGVAWEDALTLMLEPVDLTYTVRGGVLFITTQEAADTDLLQKIIWLEGTGVASGNPAALIETIQASIEPDGWEALGGASTMSVLDAKRPAIVVSTTYRVHREIENFLKILRETHFGRTPVMEAVELRSGTMPTANPSGFGGGQGGGGGFF